MALSESPSAISESRQLRNAEASSLASSLVDSFSLKSLAVSQGSLSDDIGVQKYTANVFSPTPLANFSDDMFDDNYFEWNLDALTLTSGQLSPLPHDADSLAGIFSSIPAPSFSTICSSSPIDEDYAFSSMSLFSSSSIPVDSEAELYDLSSLSLSTSGPLPSSPPQVRKFEAGLSCSAASAAALAAADATSSVFHSTSSTSRYSCASSQSSCASFLSATPNVFSSALLSPSRSTSISAASSPVGPIVTTDLSLSSLSEVLSSFTMMGSLTSNNFSSLPDDPEIGPLPLCSSEFDESRDWEPKSQNSSHYSSDSSFVGQQALSDTDDDYFPFAPKLAEVASIDDEGTLLMKEECARKRKVSTEGPRASCHQCKTSLNLQELVQCTFGHEQVHRRSRSSSIGKKGSKSDASRRNSWSSGSANPFVWNNNSYSEESKATHSSASCSPPLSSTSVFPSTQPNMKKLKPSLYDDMLTSTRSKTGKCRKKYCLRCFSEYLNTCSLEHAAQALETKSCPACSLVCHCAACGRKMGVMQAPSSRISCHQCKHQSTPVGALCCTRVKDKANPRGCRKKFCSRCLLSYKISAQQVHAETWLCPACVGICECSTCRDRTPSSSHFSVPLPAHPRTKPSDPSSGRRTRESQDELMTRKKPR